MRTPRAIRVAGVLGALALLACAGASGCLRESTGCVDDAECGAGLVCSGAVCALPPAPDVGGGDAGGGDVGGLDTGRPDGGAEDAGPPDASEDVGGDADAGGEDPRWQVLVSGVLSRDIDSTMRPDGRLVVAYSPSGSDTVEVLARRPDGAVLAPNPAALGSGSFNNVVLVAREGDVDLVAVNEESELVMLRAAGQGGDEVDVVLPLDGGRIAVLTNEVIASPGGGVVGGLTTLAMETAVSVSTRVEWFDRAAGATAVVLDEAADGEAGAHVGAVTVRRGEEHVVLWHLEPGAIEYTEVGADGPPAGALVLDEATEQELGGPGIELGFMPVAFVDDVSRVWVAYLRGDVLENTILVRTLEPNGDVLASPDIDPGSFRGVVGMDMVVSGGEAHVVYQELNTQDQGAYTSELVHARYDGSSWTRTVLDPSTGEGNFVEVYAGEGGMHVVYTAYEMGLGFMGEVRYQWVAF